MTEALQIQSLLPPELAAFIEIIDRAASNPDVDVNKLEKLLDMQERVLKRNAETSFNRSMSKAQQDIKQVVANADNPQTRSKYATYDALDNEIRPVYIENGFALSFGTEDCPRAEHLRVVLDISHADGHSRRYQIDMPADGMGPKGNPVMTKTHAVGAGVSYGMRYLLKMAFNIAVVDDDNDGNGPTIDDKQVADLRALAEEARKEGESVADVLKKTCSYFQVDRIENLLASQYKNAVEALEKRKKNA